MSFNPRQLLAGIGILLFGINLFEQALKYLGGDKIKGVLEKFTHNRRTSLITGFTTTSLVNSSTMVTLLTIIFVGAGTMQLYNAIGVILGANIGSVTWSVIIAFFGFGELKISVIAFPLIGIGGIMHMFKLSERAKMWARLLIGFGLLFLGIDFMKESVESLKANFDLAAYKDGSLWIFGVLGIVATAVLHSSGALGIMTLAALQQGIISFPASVAINMGANIGTTFTAFYASLGGKKIKRQVAMSHVMFNLLSTGIGVIFFWGYIKLTAWVMHIDPSLLINTATTQGVDGKEGETENIVVIANAILNFIFNFTTALLFCFFLKSYTRFIEWMIPNTDAQQEETEMLAIDNLDLRKTDIESQTLAIHNDTKILVKHAQYYINYMYGLDKTHINEDNPKIIDWDKQEHITQYEKTKTIADKLLTAVFALKEDYLSQKQRKSLHKTETAIYSALKAIKAVKNIRRDIMDLRHSTHSDQQNLFDHTRVMQLHTSRTLTLITEKNDVNNYEMLISATEGLKKYHAHFIELINTIAKHKKEGVSLPTMININHYVYEANEMLLLAYANLYLPKDKIEAFETTQDIDEEIYETFTTD